MPSEETHFRRDGVFSEAVWTYANATLPRAPRRHCHGIRHRRYQMAIGSRHDRGYDVRRRREFSASADVNKQKKPKEDFST
jgi:hypothetical protein